MDRQEQHRNGLGSSEASSTSSSSEEGLKWAFYDLDFSVHKSRRYHDKLRAFYGVWRDAVKIVTIISGSGLWFLLFAGAPHLAEWLAAFVAVWAVIDYMVAPDRKADQHRRLWEQFTELAAKIERSPRTQDAYSQLAAERLELEKDEPPCKRLVDLQARNDECRARDFPPEDLAPLSGAQRIFGYFATFGMERIEEWKAKRQRAVRG